MGKRSMVNVGVILTSALSFSLAVASPTVATQSKQGKAAHATSQFASFSQAKQKSIAKNFGITPKEYKQYQYYMRWTPDRYNYAKNTNP